MADKKISQLDLLTASTVGTGDYLPIVDSGASSVTRRIKNTEVGNLVKNGDENYKINDALNQTSGVSGFIVGLNNKIHTGDSSYCFGKLNEVSGDNDFCYGFNNEMGSGVTYSQAFGKSNNIKNGNHNYAIGQDHVISGVRNVAVGFKNDTRGNDSFAFGKNVRTPANVAEFGIWNSTSSRGASVRCSNLGDAYNPGDGFVAFSLPNTGTQFGISSNAEGLEPAIRLPKEMCMFRRSGTEVFVDVNDNNTIRSVSLGNATDVSNTSAGAPVQNVRADSVTITTMRQLTQAEYNAITPDANTFYVIVG